MPIIDYVPGTSFGMPQILPRASTPSPRNALSVALFSLAPPSHLSPPPHRTSIALNFHCPVTPLPSSSMSPIAHSAALTITNGVRRAAIEEAKPRHSPGIPTATPPPLAPPPQSPQTLTRPPTPPPPPLSQDEVVTKQRNKDGVRTMFESYRCIKLFLSKKEDLNVPFFSSSEYSIFSYLSNLVLLASPFAGHDCPYKSFSKNKLVEDIVGTLVSLSLIFPNEPWRFKHDRHHAKTNMLMWHFDLKKFRTNEVKRVKISLACVFAFMAIGWPLIIYKTENMQWIKFWFMPWLGLFLTYLGLYLMKGHRQPALLYLVPCTLGNKKSVVPFPLDLYHLIKKAVSIRKHLERNRKDKDSKFRLICGLRPHTQRVEKVVGIGFQLGLDPGKFGCLSCVCNIPKLGEEGQAEKGAKEGGSKVLGQVLLQTSHILP
ncbi:hypothetical protein AHAS_Ahas11G0112600 [Arachis hypogaea]